MNGKLSTAARVPGRPQSGIIRFRVGSYTLGIAAGSLQEICRDHDLTRGERERLAILSGHEIFGVVAGTELHLLILNPGSAAFRVDRVERMVVTGSIHALPKAFQGDERIWFQGLAIIDGVILPIVNPATIEREAHARAQKNLDAAAARQEARQERVST
ncbi:MAG: hypothetical protein WAO35_25870 [Terriglobia bacterium]